MAEGGGQLHLSTLISPSWRIVHQRPVGPAAGAGCLSHSAFFYLPNSPEQPSRSSGNPRRPLLDIQDSTDRPAPRVEAFCKAQVDDAASETLRDHFR